MVAGWMASSKGLEGFSGCFNCAIKMHRLSNGCQLSHRNCTIWIFGMTHKYILRFVLAFFRDIDAVIVSIRGDVIFLFLSLFQFLFYLFVYISACKCMKWIASNCHRRWLSRSIKFFIRWITVTHRVFFLVVTKPRLKTLNLIIERKRIFKWDVGVLNCMACVILEHRSAGSRDEIMYTHLRSKIPWHIYTSVPFHDSSRRHTART